MEVENQALKLRVWAAPVLHCNRTSAYGKDVLGKEQVPARPGDPSSTRELGH